MKQKLKIKIMILTAMLMGYVPFANALTKNDEVGQEEGLESLLFAEIPIVSFVSLKEEKASEAPASVTVITAAEIERYGYRTIWDAIKTVPGVTVLRGLLSRPRIVIRGLDSMVNEKVLFLLNGATISSFVWGPGTEDPIGNIAVENIAAIEVIRGPTSALYGGGGMTGVINIKTKTAKVWDGASASMKAGKGFISGGVGYGKTMGDLEFSVYADYTKDEGQEFDVPVEGQGLFNIFGMGVNSVTAAPTVAEDPDENRSAALSFNWKGLSLEYHYYDFSTPAYISWVCVNPKDADALKVRNKLHVPTLEYKWKPMENLEITPSATYAYGSMHLRVSFINDWPFFTPGVYDETRIGSDSLTSHFQTAFETYNFKVTTHWQPNDNHYIVLGVGHQLETVPEEKGGNSIFVKDLIEMDIAFLNTSRKTKFAFLQESLELWDGKVRFLAGLRYDNIHVDDGFLEDPKYAHYEGRLNPPTTKNYIYTTSPKDQKFVKPRVGVVYKPHEKTTLKFIFNQAFRPPNAAELGKWSPFLLGNTGLKSEHITLYEISAVQEMEKGQVEAAFYMGKIKNVILRSPGMETEYHDGVPIFPYEFLFHGNGEIPIYRNAGNAEMVGLEIGGRYPLTDKLGVKGNYSYASVKSEKTGEQWPIYAAHMLDVGVVWNLWGRLTLTLEEQYRSAQKQIKGYPAPYDGDYPAYALTHMNASYAFTNYATVSVRVNNIFDKQYADPANALIVTPTGFPARGREIYTGVKISF